MYIWRTIAGTFSLIFLISANAAFAEVDESHCKKPDSGQDLGIGSGFKLSKECFAPDYPEGSSDAYYRLVFEVRPKPGFENAANFKHKDFFKSFLQTITGQKDRKTLSFTVSVESQGRDQFAQENIPLMTFLRKDKSWTSFVGGTVKTKYFYLSDGDSIFFRPRYFFSNERSVDLNSIPDIIGKSGVEIASKSTKKFFDLANNVSNAIISQNNQRSLSVYQNELGNNTKKRYSAVYEISDPKDSASVFAEIEVTLEGRRSYFSNTATYNEISKTLPTGLLASDDVDKLAKAISAEDASNDPAVSTIIPITALGAIPFSEVPNEDGIGKFCRAISSATTNQYALSTFDSLMLRATVLKRVTDAVEDSIPRFDVCFSKDEIPLIEKHLGWADKKFSFLPSSAQMGAAITRNRGVFAKIFELEDARARGRIGQQLFAANHRYVNSDGIPLFVDMSIDPAEILSDQIMPSVDSWRNFTQKDGNLATNIGWYVFPQDNVNVKNGQTYALGNFMVHTYVGEDLQRKLVASEVEAVVILNFGPIRNENERPKIAEIQLISNPSESQLVIFRDKFVRRCLERNRPWKPKLVCGQ